MAVFFEGVAAACGVDDDVIDFCTFEAVDHLSGEGLGLVGFALVFGEGGAAALGFGDDDFAAVGAEDAGGGLVDAGEEDALDAAEDHATR